MLRRTAICGTLTGMGINLRAAFQNLGRSLGKSNEANSREDVNTGSKSMVLLLRQPSFLTLERLREAGSQVFGAPFSDDQRDTHCVVQRAMITSMVAEPHKISFLHYSRPYGDSPEHSREFGRAMATESQRQAWAEHNAWTAVVYVAGIVEFDLAHALLARLCAQVVDDNCAGVYMPGGRVFIPNDGSLLPALEQLGSAGPAIWRWN